MIKKIFKNNNIDTLNVPLIGYISSIGFAVPHYCYHENLSISGNCRMCAIEISVAPKPVVCCAYNALVAVEKNDSIFYDSALATKVRENILEFLLLNHPLDCPVCDQGGDCDLQDQALYFGSSKRRFYNFKRSVPNPYIGTSVKTVMTRCIHCTRCVRFATEIMGFNELGELGRGSNSQIGTFINSTVPSILSENIIDLCPVGTQPGRKIRQV